MDSPATSTVPPTAQDADKTLHVGLLWHTFRSENLGVAALTFANLSLIAAAVEKAGYRPVFHCIGSRGQVDYSAECPYENDFTNVGYKALVNPFSDLHRMFGRCDIVFDIGAGDSFSDLYSWGRFGMMLSSKVAAARTRAKLVLSPQTIGPFLSMRSRLAAKAVLQLAHHIFARDEKSLKVLEELGMSRKSSLTTDVAFALPYDAPADKDQRDLNHGRIKVGLNVSALMYRQDIPNGSRVKLTVDYPALIDRLIERFSNDPRYEIHFVPHVLAQHMAFEDDYAVSETLKKRFPDAILPPRFAGPSDAKSYIAGLDLLLGSRMHATIAALSSNTAVVPLGYSRKFTGLFESLDYGWNADMTSETNEAVMAKVEAALADVSKVRADAIASNVRARERLGNYREFLDRTIAELVAKRA